jgi:hypothetical protein
MTLTVQMAGGIPAVATVAHYDADGRLVSELLHIDGEFVVPPTLRPGDSIWMRIPDVFFGPVFQMPA